MPFLQLVVDLAGADLDRAEEACSRLGAIAVTLGDAGDAPVLEPAPGETPLWPLIRLHALFPASVAADATAAALAGELGVAPGAVAVERVDDRVWEREWLKDFRPMRFGRRLWVCPAGQRPAGPTGALLSLDPGLAFGTGTHPTTALCLAWLDGEIRGGERVLDYGCGSGILALAALSLGAAGAAAVDIDPQALLATRENAAKNGLAAQLVVAQSADGLEGAFDIVLANILSGPLVALAPELAARARGDGKIVLAGLLDRQAGEVAQAYRPWFDIRPAAEREGWTLLAGRRRPE
jgi:ribosomal protein L11 methyltransferase